MGKRYVITDIHGCFKTFQTLVSETLELQPGDHLYLLGDYIDRGPGSKEVLDFIFELTGEGYHIYPIRGNHEQFLLNSLSDAYEFETWATYNGGDTTLKSFGIGHASDIPEKYLTFIENLPFYLVLEDCYLVHAGFNFNSTAPFEDKMAMINIRKFPVKEKDLEGRKILHGHTPTPLNIIEDKLKQREALTYNLDAGCVYPNHPGMGNLVALELNSWKLFSAPCEDEIHKV